MEKLEHQKYSQKDLDWQRSVIEWFKEKGVPVEENDEFFIYPVTSKNGETIKIHTPKRKRIELKGEGYYKNPLTKDLIAAQIEFAKEYSQENFPIIEIYERYVKKYGLNDQIKNKK